MKQFSSVADVENVDYLVKEAITLKLNPHENKIGRNKTLGLIFFNPSLRTRLSTQKAAFNLGMDVMVMNIDRDSWSIEFEDGIVMNGPAQEHVKDAVRVISQYCDVLGVRSFAGLTDREEDYNEKVYSAFLNYSAVPVISLESATRHPLQSLADLITIQEFNIKKPKIAVSWAPHPNALPQAVVNSFLEWISKTDAEVVLAHPEGYELHEKFTQNVYITSDQYEALKDADFVYVKNWSSYKYYGKTPEVSKNWTIDRQKMKLTNNGHFMHCLPVRRNVVAADDVIDNSIVYQQAKNREYAAQLVLKKILEGLA